MCVSRLKGGGGLGKKTSDRVNVQVLTSVLFQFFLFFRPGSSRSRTSPHE